AGAPGSLCQRQDATGARAVLAPAYPPRRRLARLRQRSFRAGPWVRLAAAIGASERHQLKSACRPTESVLRTPAVNPCVVTPRTMGITGFSSRRLANTTGGTRNGWSK